MTLSDGIQLYGAAITTLTILAASIRYILNSHIKPLNDEISELREDNKSLESKIEKQISELKNDNEDIESKISALKQALVNDIKEISQGNFEFRFKYESSIQELRLLLAEKYSTKEDLDKEIDDLKGRVIIHQELKSIRRHIEDIKNEGKK